MVASCGPSMTAVKHFAICAAVAPHERVVVERVADGDQLRDGRFDSTLLLVAERLELQRPALRTVGHQRCLATGAAQRDDSRAAQSPAVVEQFQGLQHLGRRCHRGHAVAGEQRVVRRGASRHRAGVRRGDRCTGGRPAGVQGDDRHTLGMCTLRHAGEVLRIAHRFEEQSDRADARVIEERVDAILHPDAGLVADGDDRAETQPSLLEREVDGDVAALRDDGNALTNRMHAVLVGPQCDAVERVDEAVAVRPEERHVARRLEQLALQVDGARARRSPIRSTRRFQRPSNATRSSPRPWHAD